MRPIDADEFKKYIDAQEGRPFIGCTVGEAMKILIDEQPTVQPEIIRCKDCKYNVSSRKCLQPDSFFLVTSDDFYCGYAERRTDD